MTFSKKIFSFLLSLLIALPLFVGVFFIAKQQYIKHEMKEALETKQLISLRLNKHEIIWHEEGKELLIEHKKFDVKQIIKNSDGSLYVTGLFDDDEKRLDELLEKTMNAKKNNLQWFAKIFFSVYSNNNFSQTINANFVPIEKKFLSIYHTQLIPAFLVVLTPPPEC